MTLYIYDNDNMEWLDAATTYGLRLEDGGLSALVTPAPTKAIPSNQSRLESGKRYLVNDEVMQYDERNITLPFYILASGYADLAQKRDALMAILSKGYVTLRTAAYPSVVYHLLYQSMTQWSEFDGRIARFSARFVEPDPTNRTL